MVETQWVVRVKRRLLFLMEFSNGVVAKIRHDTKGPHHKFSENVGAKARPRHRVRRHCGSGLLPRFNSFRLIFGTLIRHAYYNTCLYPTTHPEMNSVFIYRQGWIGVL